MTRDEIALRFAIQFTSMPDEYAYFGNENQTALDAFRMADAFIAESKASAMRRGIDISESPPQGEAVLRRLREAIEWSAAHDLEFFCEDGGGWEIYTRAGRNSTILSECHPRAADALLAAFAVHERGAEGDDE